MPGKIAVLALAFAFAAPAMWLDVPFVRQSKNGCGPASVSMVVGYWQGTANPAQIERAIYSPGVEGAYAADIERYLRQEGFTVLTFRGEWADLEQHISKGRPVIISLGKS